MQEKYHTYGTLSLVMGCITSQQRLSVSCVQLDLKPLHYNHDSSQMEVGNGGGSQNVFEKTCTVAEQEEVMTSGDERSGTSTYIYDRKIVSMKITDLESNKLVFSTF